MKKFLSFYMMLFFVLCMMVVYAGVSQANKLTRVFHHEGTFGDKVVLYFAQEPIVNQVADRPYNKKITDQQQVAFFFPLAKVANAQVQKLIDKINAAQRPFYTVHIEQVSKPLEGIKVTLTYSPATILFEYEKFNAIHTHKGIAFQFYSKDKLNEIHQKTDGILKLVSKKKPLVVVDCGHGGTDAGAISRCGLKEKDIAFSVGNKLARLLNKGGYSVALTRSKDTDVLVDQRTSMANGIGADLFVSIHANATSKPNVSGLETYYATLAAIGNKKNNDPALRSFIELHDQRSSCFAQLLHQNTLRHIGDIYPLVDRQVKTAFSQVLFGTEMPAALVELGFLSNPVEARFLANDVHQDTIACGLYKGIDVYCKRYL